MANAAAEIYWHRDLPPLDAVAVAEHTVEADSARVPGTIAHRDELWDACQRELTADVATRVRQEIGRLGGRYAHVLDERIEVKHDAATDQAWLHGRYTYMLYR